MRTNSSNYTAGGVYEKIKAAGLVQTPSYLRLEQSIQGTFNQINFQVLVNEGSPNNTERRLQITDLFTITGMSVMIFKAGTTTTATQAQIAAAQLRTWPNPLVFTGAAEAEALMSIYNGYLTVEVNSKRYIDSIDCERFRRIGTSQFGVGSSATDNEPVQADEKPVIDWGFGKMVPTITLSGAGKNLISINLPVSTALGGTSSQNFCVCYLRGLLTQNGSVLNPEL